MRNLRSLKILHVTILNEIAAANQPMGNRSGAVHGIMTPLPALCKCMQAGASFRPTPKSNVDILITTMRCRSGLHPVDDTARSCHSSRTRPPWPLIAPHWIAPTPSTLLCDRPNLVHSPTNTRADTCVSRIRGTSRRTGFLSLPERKNL